MVRSQLEAMKGAAWGQSCAMSWRGGRKGHAGGSISIGAGKLGMKMQGKVGRPGIKLPLGPAGGKQRAGDVVDISMDYAGNRG